jgi:hypothetical protein
MKNFQKGTFNVAFAGMMKEWIAEIMASNLN